MRTLAKYFAKGLLFLIPVAATFYILYWLFTSVDMHVRTPLEEAVGAPLTRGLGVLITLALILLVGLLVSLFITRPLFLLVERLLERVPLVKLLYSSLKDLVGAFMGDKKKFDQPVLLTLNPAGNVKAVGFVTRKSLDFLDLHDEVAVYCPQSYNFAGNVLILPRSQVQPIDLDSSDMMAFVVSGGVSGPTAKKTPAPSP